MVSRGRQGERIALSFLESMKYVGESASLDILRKGQPLTFEASPARSLIKFPKWQQQLLLDDAVLHQAGKTPTCRDRA